MPYIKARLRDDAHAFGAAHAGALNYLFSDIIADYINKHDLSYQTINDIVGALEGAKMEFYSRIARPYEDQKIQENGDVY